MNNTPISNRLHISFFGRRNSGKSSVINAFTGQQIAVVSDVPGTTTDPVYKTMELLPLGPVVVIDTAGLDDEGNLGNLRKQKTYEVLRKTNVAVIVINAVSGLTAFEEELTKEIKNRDIQIVGVINKIDIQDISNSEADRIGEKLGIPVCKLSSKTGQGIENLKQMLIKHVKNDDADPGLVDGLVKPNDVVVLVTPIDKGAPKGRLILPQQQTIRDILEHDAIAVVTKENGLETTLNSLAKKPAIVITDSQAFQRVSAETPKDIPLTSFSIIFARQKADLAEMVRGIKRIETLKAGDRVLIIEGCTHHRQSDDIGKVKIPKWIKEIAGEGIEFDWASGVHYPPDIEEYAAIIHCGGCMLNRQEMQFRLKFARDKGICITNYGMLIAYTQGILERALKPFPELAGIL